MKILFATGLLMLVNVVDIHAEESTALSPMQELYQLVRDLAETDGFTDEDASKASVFLLEKLIGPKHENQTLSVQVRESEPESVTVFAGYDCGIGFTGYDFKFKRGDVSKGMRFAGFWSLTVVPSE